MLPLLFGHGLSTLGGNGREVSTFFGRYRLAAQRTGLGANFTELRIRRVHGMNMSLPPSRQRASEERAANRSEP
jgi:hypothetical protein